MLILQMEYLSELNLSKYQIKINYDINLYFVKCNKIYDDLDLLNNHDVIMEINRYSEDQIKKIIDYCRNNKFIENYDNYQMIYFNDLYKCISDTDINYYKDINLNIKNLITRDNDYVSYVNIHSAISSFKFPSLVHYDKVINKKIHSFTKRFVDDGIISIIEKKNDNIDCVIEIFDNKCNCKITLGNNNHKFKLTNQMINQIKEILDLLQINISIESLAETINNIQIKF